MDNHPTTEESGQPSKKNQPPIPSEEKSGIELPPRVSKLRWKLGQKAKQEPRFRFYTLYDRITRADVLMTAWWLVLAHNGAPGVDGISCQDIIDGPGAETYLRELREELVAKRYRPQPVKRVYIPKPDGRLRPLGIPICRSYCTSLQRRWGLKEVQLITTLYFSDEIDCGDQERRVGLRKPVMISDVSLIHQGP